MVRVTVNGLHQVLKVEIDKSVAEGDVALLEDLVRAATNSAMGQVSEKLKQSIGGMAQNMGIDPSMFGFGGS